MHPADQALIDRDPALPGLALLLDDHALSTALAAQLPGLKTARVTYLRYKPQTHCLATLQLDHDDGGRHTLWAKALPAASHDWQWQSERLTKRARRGGISLALPASYLILASPEHDRRLKTALPPGAAILRYKPERRLVARLDEQLLRYTTASDYSATRHAIQIGAACGGAPLTACDDTQHLLQTAWLPGDTLSTPTSAELRQTGALLATLHRAPVPADLPPRGDENTALAQTLATIQTISPAHSARVRALIQRTADGLAHTYSVPCHNHGDLSPDQTLREADGNLRLIDWDNTCLAAPESDLGTYLGKTHARTAIPVQELAAALLHDYNAPCDRAALYHYTAAALIRLLPEGFRQRRRDWPQHLERLLTSAEHLERIDNLNPPPLRSGGGIGAPHEKGECLFHGNPGWGCEKSRSDESHELHPANDPAYMQAALRAALAQPALILRDLTVLRHKAGRRALIAYTIENTDGVPQTILGKQRAKGVDKHGYRIQRALWQQGFDLPGVAVPETLAILPAARLWLQRQVAGEPATHQLTPNSPPALWAHIGAALASLHRANIASKRRWTIADELTLLHDRLEKAAALRPPLAARIRALLPALTALGTTLADRPLCGIHRDCYPDQILTSPYPGVGAKNHEVPITLTWLDLDLYAHGDPALDAGNFLAHMTEHALRHYHDATALAAQEEALARQWLADSPLPTDAPTLAAWTTLALARHIYLSTQFPAREHTTAPLLALCEQRLGAC